MRLVYLSTALPDAVWMRRYYRSIFPQGGRQARERFYAVEKLILENPHIGHPVEGGREFPISGTPFRIIYRVQADAIEILRIWDGRRDPSTLKY
jgi:toxin ParE1/3/4